MDGITNSVDIVSLSKLRKIVKDKKAWCAAAHGAVKSRTRLSDQTTMYIKNTRLQKKGEEQLSVISTLDIYALDPLRVHNF